MKTLYLLRHAHTEKSAPPPMGDHERVLSVRGEAEADAVAAFLRGRGVIPGFVLSSTSLRALQTVRIVYARLLREEGAKVWSHFDRALYLAPASLLREGVAAVADEVDALLLVAHNPGIAELAQTLSGGALADYTQDFPPGALAVFQVGAQHWRELSPKTVKLDTVFLP